MPGLVGIITRLPAEIALAQLTQMLDSMRHESFYVAGTWSDPALGVYAGWVARVGTFSAAMPVANERGDLTLLFSGEDYPEVNPALDLRRRGHEVPASGPSYLVHLAEEDAGFPAGLNGIFQGLLIDRQRRQAKLFNDRYGMRRIYYHESAGGFYFAAEAKAILAVHPETRRLTPASVAEFVSFGCVIGNRTLFEGIEVLPQGSAWTFEEGRLVARGRYFDPREWEAQEPLDAAAYYQETREAFRQGLPAYLSSEERLGVALTGGLDTRVIMAWQRQAAGSLPCYTFGGTLRESQDVKIARRVAAAAGQPYQVLTVGDAFLDRFSHYAERTVYLTDGTVGVSNAPDLFVSELARQIAPAKIVGTWGSELMRQVVSFRPQKSSPGLFADGFAAELTGAEDRYWELRRGHTLSFSAFWQTAWSHFGIESLEQTQLTIRPPFLSNRFVRSVYRAPALASADVRARLVMEGNPALGGIPSDRGVRADDGGSLGFMRRGLQEFTFKCEYAFDAGMPQWLAPLNQALRTLRLERAFLGRHKFTHFRTWYQGVLGEYVRQVLLDERALSRDYVRRDTMQRMVGQHLAGTANHTAAIHTLLSLELVHRQFTGR